MTKKKNSQAEFIKWFGPVLEALRALGGSAKPKEIAEWIGKAKEIPDEILNARYEKSGQLKFLNQIAWARQYLVWEGLLDSSKHGVWALTPARLEYSFKRKAITRNFFEMGQSVSRSQRKKRYC